MNNGMRVLLGCVFALFSTQLFAEFSYDYLSASYVDREEDIGFGFDAEADGYQIELSKDLGGNVVITARYVDLEYDDFSGTVGGLDTATMNVETDKYFLRIGGYAPLTHTLDFVLGMSAGSESLSGDVEIDGSTVVIDDIDSEFWGALIGLRYLILKQLELNGSIGYDQFFHSDIRNLAGEGGFSFGAGLRFHPIEEMSLGANFETTEDSEVDTITVDLRYQF